jgi:HlyD family secretion protein
MVNGHVSYINPTPSIGMRGVDIALDSALPEGVSADVQVDATIELGKLKNIFYVGRPVHANQNSSIGVFKVINRGEEAVRVNVKFGRAAVNTIEVLQGLKEGGKIIRSDMSAWDNFDRIRLK